MSGCTLFTTNVWCVCCCIRHGCQFSKSELDILKTVISGVGGRLSTFIVVPNFSRSTAFSIHKNITRRTTQAVEMIVYFTTVGIAISKSVYSNTSTRRKVIVLCRVTTVVKCQNFSVLTFLTNSIVVFLFAVVCHCGARRTISRNFIKRTTNWVRKIIPICAF